MKFIIPQLDYANFIKKQWATVAFVVYVMSGCSGKPASSTDSVVDSVVTQETSTETLYPCSNPGQACDAHDPCAINPICGDDNLCRPSGVKNCDDGLECTQDLCKDQSGACEHLPQSGTCVVSITSGNGSNVLQCVNANDVKLDNPCHICDPAQSQTAWSPRNGGACDDANFCTKDDYCQSGVCKGTDYHAECDDALSCTQDCDGKGGCNSAHPLDAGWCVINNTCYSAGSKQTTACEAICDPTVNAFGWTAIGSFCVVGETCYASGQKDPTGCYQCLPATNSFGLTQIVQPNCQGRTCGQDPVCGDSCGTCGADQYCTEAGTCNTQIILTTSDTAAKPVTFGHSVAMDDDTLIVGAPQNNSAYLFVRSGSTWAEQTKLTGSDVKSFVEFGSSVVVSGTTAIVGASHMALGPGYQHGAAYVFTRSGSTWTEQTKLTASDVQIEAQLGISATMSGNTLILGAHQSDEGRGSAYVFTRSGSTWTEKAKISASDGTEWSFFGTSVALSGTTLVVGSPLDDPSNYDQAGSAYVFTRSGTTWTQKAKLTASDMGVFDQFGKSVAISGDTILIGAVGANTTFDGAAYVFTRSGTTWTEQAKLTAKTGSLVEEFGSAAALSGNLALIGADKNGFGQGSAHLFTRSGTTWTETTQFRAPLSAKTYHFGGSVAISNGTMIVGAPNTGTSNNLPGTVFVY